MTELISLIATVSASKVVEPLRMILERDGCSYSNKLKIEMKNKINDLKAKWDMVKDKVSFAGTCMKSYFDYPNTVQCPSFDVAWKCPSTLL